MLSFQKFLALTQQNEDNKNLFADYCSNPTGNAEKFHALVKNAKIDLGKLKYELKNFYKIHKAMVHQLESTKSIGGRAKLEAATDARTDARGQATMKMLENAKPFQDNLIPFLDKETPFSKEPFAAMALPTEEKNIKSYIKIGKDDKSGTEFLLSGTPYKVKLFLAADSAYYIEYHDNDDKQHQNFSLVLPKNKPFLLYNPKTKRTLELMVKPNNGKRGFQLYRKSRSVGTEASHGRLYDADKATFIKRKGSSVKFKTLIKGGKNTQRVRNKLLNFLQHIQFKAKLDPLEAKSFIQKLAQYIKQGSLVSKTLTQDIYLEKLTKIINDKHFDAFCKKAGCPTVAAIMRHEDFIKTLAGELKKPGLSPEHKDNGLLSDEGFKAMNPKGFQLEAFNDWKVHKNVNEYILKYKNLKSKQEPKQFDCILSYKGEPKQAVWKYQYSYHGEVKSFYEDDEENVNLTTDEQKIIKRIQSLVNQKFIKTNRDVGYLPTAAQAAKQLKAEKLYVLYEAQGDAAFDDVEDIEELTRLEDLVKQESAPASTDGNTARRPFNFLHYRHENISNILSAVVRLRQILRQRRAALDARPPQIDAARNGMIAEFAPSSVARPQPFNFLDPEHIKKYKEAHQQHFKEHFEGKDGDKEFVIVHAPKTRRVTGVTSYLQPNPPKGNNEGPAVEYSSNHQISFKNCKNLSDMKKAAQHSLKQIFNARFGTTTPSKEQCRKFTLTPTGDEDCRVAIKTVLEEHGCKVGFGVIATPEPRVAPAATANERADEEVMNITRSKQ